jgi:hypothetical protein
MNEPKAPAIVQALVILGLSAVGWALLWFAVGMAAAK